MLRVLASCLCALLFLPGWSADPVRPALYFSGFGWMDRNTAGVSLSVSEGRASYWSGSRVYLFNPDQPLDRRLEVRDLGPKVGKEHRLAIHDGRIYVSNGRRIRTTLPGEAPQGAKPWFEREGQFHRFEVMDPSTVALLWVDPKGEHHEPLQEGHSGSEIRSRGIRLLEIWAVETNTLRHAVEVPEDMLAVMDAFQPFPFGDMRLYRSGEHLLIHVPVLGRMYAFDTARRRFTRLRTPWTEVDMGWIRPQLAGLKPGQPCVFYAPTLPMYLCASPTGDSSLLLATTVLPLTDASHGGHGQELPLLQGSLPPASRGSGSGHRRPIQTGMALSGVASRLRHPPEDGGGRAHGLPRPRPDEAAGPHGPGRGGLS